MATTLFCHRDQEDLEPAAFAVLDLRAGALVRKRRVPGDKGPGLPCRGVMAGPCPEESVGKTFQGKDTGLMSLTTKEEWLVHRVECAVLGQ